MATLVLTVVGGVIGGPPGAAIGASIGSFIDREVLFKPKGREGPRLSDLKLQTSSYGTQIPRLFGTMRVAGSVIWATDLIEHRTTESHKGQPSQTSYSYTASFAVALSGRAILGVGRIWADGKLLRGSAGDLKVQTGYRLHLGGEDQAADPLIVAAEGAGLAPAHRGIAYAVFEDMALGDFGNRIPSLTFEVMADPGAVNARDMLGELSDGGVTGTDDSEPLTGFAASGASLRAVAETLAGADGAWFGLDGDGIVMRRGTGAARAVDDRGVGGDGKGVRGARTIAPADAAPRTLSLTHYDPARDYQVGVQRATRPGAGTRAARAELPAAVDAAGAKRIAHAALARAETERERRTLALGWDALTIAPGDRVAIDGTPGVWRVDRWSLEAMVVSLECVAVAPGAMAAPATSGRVAGAPDLAIGETRVHAFELPPLDGNLAAAPRIAIAAGGTGPGWRSAALMLSSDSVRWEPIGSTALPAVVGEVATPPGAGPATIADRVNVLEVDLASAAMTLADADEAALDAGINLAMVGDELIQFARAEPIGGTRWRLSELWRGRRGTEAAAGTQGAGDRFVLLASPTLVVRDLPEGSVGATVQVLATGPGDSDGAEAAAAISGISMVPPAPVHLTATPEADGATTMRWIRRSRSGWRWIDGIDSPLGEESERYRVEIEPAGGPVRFVETGTPQLVLEAADRAGSCIVQVRQIGSHGLSPSASILLPPLGE